MFRLVTIIPLEFRAIVPLLLFMWAVFGLSREFALEAS